VQIGIERQTTPRSQTRRDPHSQDHPRTISEPVVASTIKTSHGVKLGVVGLATFSPGAHGEVREAVEHVLRQGARGIVFDLRSNGGGLVEEAQ